MPKLIETMRPKHWVKNVLVLAPYAFAGGNGVGVGKDGVFRLVAAFCLFCAASSAAYAFNDVMDAKADVCDPNKSGRRIGTAEAKRTALAEAVLLAALSLVGSAFIWNDGGAWIAAYLAVNAAYSIGLKEIELIDVACVTSGFAFRMTCGCGAVGVKPGAWMLATACACACYVSFGKRLVKKRRGNERIPNYTEEFLKQAMTASLTLTIAFHATWASSGETADVFGWRAGVLTGTAAFALAKYHLGFTKGISDDPTARLYKDPILAVACLAYAVCALSAAF